MMSELPMMMGQVMVVGAPVAAPAPQVTNEPARSPRNMTGPDEGLPAQGSSEAAAAEAAAAEALPTVEVPETLPVIATPPSGPAGLPAQGMGGSMTSWANASEAPTEDSFEVLSQSQINQDDL